MLGINNVGRKRSTKCRIVAKLQALRRPVRVGTRTSLDVDARSPSQKKLSNVTYFPTTFAENVSEVLGKSVTFVSFF